MEICAYTIIIYYIMMMVSTVIYYFSSKNSKINPHIPIGIIVSDYGDDAAFGRSMKQSCWIVIFLASLLPFLNLVYVGLIFTLSCMEYRRTLNKMAEDVMNKLIK